MDSGLNLKAIGKVALPSGSLETELNVAPQTPAGHLIDERTDVYGLGAILYEILTGRPPFFAPKVSEIIRQICHDAPRPPRRFKAGIERPLEAICLKALQKKPLERYASAAALAQDVQRWLADLPVRAYAEPWTSRAWRWARRHKTTMITGAGLLISTTIALALCYALVSVERTEADAQGKQARHAVSLLTKVADIGFDDQLNPLQKEFLEGALAYYNQFTTRVAGDPAVRQERGKIYQQTGDILRKLGRMPESEAAYRQAIEILEPLAWEKSAGPEPLRALARTRALLADLLVRVSRDRGQAEPTYQTSLSMFEKLVADYPANVEYRIGLARCVANFGPFLAASKQEEKAEVHYRKALAVLGAKDTAARSPATLRQRAIVLNNFGDLELGADDEAAKLAMELPRTVPGSRRAQACFDAARLLARVVGRLGGAVKLEPAERDRRSRNYAGRTALLLREAIDTDPKLAELIKTDADIKRLQSRAEFREIMNSLVKLER